MNVIPMEICPIAPPGAQMYADQITGYLLWGVLALFVAGLIVSIGGMVLGRMLNMPQLSRAGLFGVLAIIFAAVLFVLMPSIVAGITGSGCIA